MTVVPAFLPHEPRNGADSAQALLLDRAHLARYTLGDPRLEAEVLELFAGQLPNLLAALTSARTAPDWQMATHTLKGSAKAVGAVRLAIVSEQAEQLAFSGSSVDQQPVIADIHRIADETLSAITVITA